MGWGGRASTRVLARGCSACHLPTSPRGICGPAWVLRVGGGNGARSHDARWGEDGAHTQGVCDLPATGQRLAHTLSVFILFWRQQLLLQCFPVGKREAAIMDPEGWGLLMTLYQETWPHWVYGSHLNPRAQPRAGAREGLLTPLSPLS